MLIKFLRMFEYITLEKVRNSVRKNYYKFQSFCSIVSVLTSKKVDSTLIFVSAFEGKYVVIGFGVRTADFRTASESSRWFFFFSPSTWEDPSYVFISLFYLHFSFSISFSFLLFYLYEQLRIISKVFHRSLSKISNPRIRRNAWLDLQLDRITSDETIWEK